MNKVKFLLVLAFLVVLAAGAVVGMAVDRRLRAESPMPPGPPHPRNPWAQFNSSLTAEQREQMKTIWSEVNKQRDLRFQTRHQLSQKRDQQILEMLTPEERSKYEAIQNEYRAEVDQTERNLVDTVHKAEEQTRAMLSPEQQKIYDDLRARGGPPGRRGGPHGHPKTMSAPTTAPSQTL